MPHFVGGSYRLLDVINVSGHRLSTAEIESALIMHKGVAETAGVFIFLLCM
jgi:acyl-coenzyme A synthetase/AMP-(fatty) acid ligase